MRVHVVILFLIFTIVRAIRPDGVYESCSRIKKLYLNNHVSEMAKESTITLIWGSDPARVAANIFLVLAKHALGYQNIQLKKGSLPLEALKKEVIFDPRGNYTDVILALSTAWDGTSDSPWEPNEGMSINVAGPRLFEYGASMIPSWQRLHVHIAKHFKEREHCLHIASNEWNFFTDPTYTDCGFHRSPVSHRIVYELDLENKIIKEELTKRASSFLLGLEFQTINRGYLFQMLRTGNQSFFFVDYDIWENDSDVKRVQLPPCIPKAEAACQEELDNVVALRVGDIITIAETAPPLFNLAYNFTISPETIKTLLELEINKTYIEDAACDWVVENENMVDPWLVKTEFNILLFYCYDDHYRKNYTDGIRNLFTNKSEEIFGVNIDYVHPLTNCSDKNDVVKVISEYMKSAGSQRFIGAVVGNVNISTRSAKNLDALKISVLAYDALAVDEDLWTSVWFTNGRSLHLALAMRRLFNNYSWKRIAVISDPTPTAKALLDSLAKVQKENGSDAFMYHNHHYAAQQDANKVLKILKEENAHIILVNTCYENAFEILSEAVTLEMNAADKYVWIVRDWQQSNRTLDITHFMISFWSQNRDAVESSAVQGGRPKRNILKNMWSDGFWPPFAVPLADAILTLGHTFVELLKKYPKGQYDLHSEEYIKQFEKTIDLSPVKGITQNLTYKKHYLEETFVLLDEWRGDEHELLTVWRVNATVKSVEVQHLYRETYTHSSTPPTDGTLPCTFASEHAYHQTCYDVAATSGLVFLLLIPPLIILANRLVRRHIKRYENKTIFKLMVGRQQRAAQLSSYLIDRSQLEMRIELGAGRFGCVRLALLRRPKSPQKFVAAKSLRDLQDEREILREACILASLAHPHIIRLVGICIDNESPLMLMEVAFYGDLLHYLRSRRYLVDNIVTESAENVNEEAFHVSAEALTKLARQAASALGYLSFRGVIHRDLRAANCLVDVNRSLKLADFGMAREIAAEIEDGDTHYACKRRGLFPVPWMAPESLENGVFSAASDMWALGVLVFELVTLGAHPYGNMSPLRVIHFVTRGGKPSMPRDVTPQTSGLAHLCWQSDPEQRPTAAQVVAYLADRPSALRPALLPNEIKPIQVDSGYGGTPDSETLLPR